jgi:hypothetical protein
MGALKLNEFDKTTNIEVLNFDNTSFARAAFSSANGSIRALKGYTTGKYYFEIELDRTTFTTQYLGVSLKTWTLSTAGQLGFDTQSWSVEFLGGWSRYNSTATQMTGWLTDVTGLTLRVAIDYDNKKMWFSRKDPWYGSGDPETGANPTFDFTGISDALYPTIGIRGDSNTPAVRYYFRTQLSEMVFSPPDGYSTFDEGTCVAEILLAGDCAILGSPLTYANADNLDGNIQLDHLRADPSLILNGATRLLSAHCHQSYRDTGASGFFNQPLTSGKWYLEFVYATLSDVPQHPYDNVRCGIVRGTENLSGMLGSAKNDDVYMVSFGAWNANMRLYRAGLSSAFGYTLINIGDIEGIAIDLTDPTDGKMWVHNDGVWLNGDPVAGTGGISIVGAWFFAVSVKGVFKITVGGDDYKPTGFTALDTETQFVTEGLWGGNFIVVDPIGTITYTDVRLEALIGNHLLRSATWKKRSTYYLGLLTSFDPLTEVSSSGYARLPLTASNASWDETFTNLQKYSQLPFNGTVVGWALFWYSTPQLHEDPVILSRAFPEPIVCSSTEPGMAFPVGSFTWSID